MRGLARIYWTLIFVCWLACLVPAQETEAPDAEAAAPGQLAALRDGKPKGGCPLEHTTVKAAISGGVSQVTVTQRFKNPFSDKIDAVYCFPLPENAAVYDLEMKVGNRTVKGQIHPKDMARKIYENARSQGHVAALLDQERPNIFTQAVANLEPGARVDITISYLEMLPYADGNYKFVFPTVVGPRYKADAKTAPPVTPKGTRAGHDLSITVDLDAGMPLKSIDSVLHKVNVAKTGSRAHVELVNQRTIPNKDFILNFSTAKDEIQEGVLTHKGADGGYFALILAPPGRVRPDQIVPKEMVFVVDTSGSQSGAPLDKSKATMEYALKHLNPQDTFNLITFAGDTHITFPQPVPASDQNIQLARNVLKNTHGGGGTEMMKAIRASLADQQKGHARVVSFMTDGYIGNEFEILGEIDQHPGAKIFPFGIGSSVNRFLIDQMARSGAGEADYVPLNANEKKVAERFYERVRYPVLTDISLDWGGLGVTEVYPRRLPDLFASKPVVVLGRYNQGGTGQVTLKGHAGGKPWSHTITVQLPDREDGHKSVRQLWARAKIDELMGQDWSSLKSGQSKHKDAITKLGVDYRLMTQFTSFVAVEDKTVTSGGESRTVEVPVEMPEGVSYKGIYGESQDDELRANYTRGGVAATNGPLSLPRPVDRKSLPEPEPASKLDQSLLQLLALNRGKDFDYDGFKVVNGRTKVKITLNSQNADLEKLVKILSKHGLEVIAEVELSQLEGLGRQSWVKRIAPER